MGSRAGVIYIRLHYLLRVATTRIAPHPKKPARSKHTGKKNEAKSKPGASTQEAKTKQKASQEQVHNGKETKPIDQVDPNGYYKKKAQYHIQYKQNQTEADDFIEKHGFCPVPLGHSIRNA